MKANGCVWVHPEPTEWERRVYSNLLERGWAMMNGFLTKSFETVGERDTETLKAKLEAIRP